MFSTDEGGIQSAKQGAICNAIPLWCPKHTTTDFAGPDKWHMCLTKKGCPRVDQLISEVSCFQLEAAPKVCTPCGLIQHSHMMLWDTAAVTCPLGNESDFLDVAGLTQRIRARTLALWDSSTTEGILLRNCPCELLAMILLAKYAQGFVSSVAWA